MASVNTQSFKASNTNAQCAKRALAKIRTQRMRAHSRSREPRAKSREPRAEGARPAPLVASRRPFRMQCKRSRRRRPAPSAPQRTAVEPFRSARISSAPLARQQLWPTIFNNNNNNQRNVLNSFYCDPAALMDLTGPGFTTLLLLP